MTRYLPGLEPEEAAEFVPYPVVPPPPSPDDEQPLWDHQVRGLSLLKKAVSKGYRRPLLVAPPAAGKSRMIREIARGAIAKGHRVNIIVYRTILKDQICDQLKEQGIDYGSTFAGKSHNIFAPVQVSMLQTIGSRIKKAAYDIPPADVVIWDEMHMQKTGQALEINRHYRDNGAVQIGFSATPIGCNNSNDCLVIAANYTDMLECGAHPPIRCFGPSRPDRSRLKAVVIREFTEKQATKLMKVKSILGNVWKHWQKYNPHQHPAVLFASSSGSARFFVHEFMGKGIPAASLDCNGIVIAEPVKVDGVSKLVLKEFASTRERREDLFQKLKHGEIKVLCNRWVLREAWDCPEIFHAIFATPINNLTTWLQMSGRILRSHPSFEEKVVQDHGGILETPHLGMPNKDRSWFLQATEETMRHAAEREFKQKEAEEAEPGICPGCKEMRLDSYQPCACGYIRPRGVTPVRQLDDRLVETKGSNQPSDACQKIWISQLFGAARAGRSVSQAVFLARQRCQQKGIAWEPWTFKNDLKLPSDWKQPVRHVYPSFHKRKQ